MFMKIVVFLTVLVSALSFSPSSRLSTRSLRMTVQFPETNFAQDLPGASPWGFFDPLGLSSNKEEHVIRRWRESELKHGRLAMLATVGILAGETVERNTPLVPFDKIVGPAIYQFQEADAIVGYGFAALILGLIFAIEAYGIDKTWETVQHKTNRDPQNKTNSRLKSDLINGDWGFDPLKLKPQDAEGFARMQTRELNNGRLAMLGAAGMIVQELINEKGILENLGGRSIYSF